MGSFLLRGRLQPVPLKESLLLSNNDFICCTVKGEDELGEVGRVRHIPHQRQHHQQGEGHEAEPPQVPGNIS